MENHENEILVSYAAFEGVQVRLERTNRRMCILCIILIIALIGTNALWLYRESQFEDVTTTVTQDLDSGDGGTAIINDGVHINGESETDSNN